MVASHRFVAWCVVPGSGVVLPTRSPLPVLDAGDRAVVEEALRHRLPAGDWPSSVEGRRLP